MKKKLISFLAVCILIIVYACETAMPTFNDPECGLRFVQADATRGYTFLYDAPDTKETVMDIAVQSIGRVTDYDRSFVLRQVQIATDTLNAVEGVHYVTIPAERCFIPAGQAVCHIPLTLLNDESLKDTIATLRLELVDNENFRVTMRDSASIDIQISNMPIQPSNWVKDFYGTYGPEKHRFLIEMSGEKWDEEFLNSIYYDYSLRRFWCQKAQRELEKRNKELEAEKLPPLSESDGTIVTFPKWW